MKTLVSIAQKMERVINPSYYYDVRLSSRLAGIVNEITKEKSAKKKK
ncbi:MAG: hypothetical protein L6309_06450 [Candidatus Omnitrophica bacterium]|nr:hypothetical protein [Candidatus Omnitrophota bacterium]